MNMLRRRFLQGAGGAAVALPLFCEAKAATPSPTRFIVWGTPEGVIDESWWPSLGNGAPLTADALPDAASPLRPHVNDVSFLHGLELRLRGRFEVAHNVANQELLTGTKGGGVSIDQAIATTISGNAIFKSYELGVSTFGDADEKLWISQSGPGALRPTQINPVRAFDDLLGAVAGGGTDAGRLARLQRLKRRKSVLDGVVAELRALGCHVGKGGAQKLDAHLEGVRSVERSIEQMLQSADVNVPLPMIDRALDKAAKDRSKHAVIGKAQIDNVIGAIRADTCRVFTLQWSHTNDNGLSFPFLDLELPGASHHALSHEHAGAGTVDLPADKAATRRDRTKIVKFWAQQFAYLLSELKNIDEGDGTALDHTAILWASEHGSNNHRHTDIPFLLAGGGSGRFAQGRFHEFRQSGAQRSHNDLLSGLVNAYQPTITKYGDAEVNGSPILVFKKA